ncbi:hypothetical protein DL93DRAFT_2078060 [Clavulina sp. PMI_390]|nr:hypothetical protein DL93DRAFT_2078060 [Clavulina sp. PMI_390]
MKQEFKTELTALPTIDYCRAKTSVTLTALLPSWRPSISLQDRYWDSIGAERAMAQAKVTIEPIMDTLRGFEGEDFHDMGFTMGGEIFFLWLVDCIRLFDFRTLLRYNIDLSHVPRGASHLCPGSWHVVHLICYEGQEGVLFAGSCL